MFHHWRMKPFDRRHLIWSATFSVITTSPPKVIWEERVATLHVGECTLLLHVLAVQCATLRNRYGSVTGCCGALQNIMERCGKLRDITERYRSVADRYGSLRNRYTKYRFCPSLIIFKILLITVLKRGRVGVPEAEVVRRQILMHTNRPTITVKQLR